MALVPEDSRLPFTCGLLLPDTETLKPHHVFLRDGPTGHRPPSHLLWSQGQGIQRNAMFSSRMKDLAWLLASR